MRILAVDLGEKRIGIAISDPTHSIAKPLCIISHRTRKINAEKVLGLCKENNVGEVIIGMATHSDGSPNYMGRKSKRFLEELKEQSEGEIVFTLWDESYSSQDAVKLLQQLGVKIKSRKYTDDVAAQIILQSYIDSQSISL